MRNSHLRKFAAALLALATLLPAGQADELSDLRQALQALEQKIAVLERKQEIRDEAAAAAAPATPKVTVNDKGFTLASADEANSLRLRGLVQLDLRQFFNDGGATAGLNNNGFVLRRARLFFEGTFNKIYSYQLVPEFGGGSGTAATTPSLLDANMNVAFSPGFQVRVGKFKSPVGLELLQSESAIFFTERSLVTNLVPNRDLGVLASGDLPGRKLSYTVGVVNGVPDGASSTNADFDNDKDIVGRLFVTPFKDAASSPLQGLSFGLAGSLGREKSAAARTAGYKTDGQQTFFTYNSATIGDGQTWRLSPQLDYRNGSFGLLGEYVVSTVNVRPGTTGAKAQLENKAWQIGAGYVLTGENSTYNGVVPQRNFDPATGTWGAFEVVARYSNLRIDDAAFPLFASPANSADEASAFGVGLNWYLTKAVVVKMDFFQTKFGVAPGAPAISANAVLRQDENSLITRFQLNF